MYEGKTRNGEVRASLKKTEVVLQATEPRTTDTIVITQFGEGYVGV